ncbi:MAG: dTMP kinase [Thermodesulfobacteriota bacterium]
MHRNRSRELDRGVFLAFEGIDGAGKTTQALRLQERLLGWGLEAVYVKEPTNGLWGSKIKRIAENGRDGVSPREELDYFIQDRAEDVRDNIAPALASRKAVVADRYFYSTIAYQSALGLDPEEIRGLNAPFPVPDLVFLLEIPPELSQVRITRHRGQQANKGYEQLDFLRRVKAAFDRLTDDNLVRLDGDQAPEAIEASIWLRVHGLLSDRLV